MNKDVEGISITVVNPDTRDFETYKFEDSQAAEEWLRKRNTTRKIDVKSED